MYNLDDNLTKEEFYFCFFSLLILELLWFVYAFNYLFPNGVKWVCLLQLPFRMYIRFSVFALEFGELMLNSLNDNFEDN